MTFDEMYLQIGGCLNVKGAPHIPVHFLNESWALDAVLRAQQDPEALCSLPENEQALLFARCQESALTQMRRHRVGYVAACGCFVFPKSGQTKP